MRDPITEWEVAIGKRVEYGILFIPIFLMGLFLVAPLFGPYIKTHVRRQNVMYEDYELRTNRHMRVIYLILWAFAILGWGFVYYSYINR